MVWRDEHLSSRGALFEGLKENGRITFNKFLKKVLGAGQEELGIKLYLQLGCASFGLEKDKVKRTFVLSDYP